MKPHHLMQFCIIFGTLIEGVSYPSAEMQSTYSTAPTDWASVTSCSRRRVLGK